MWTVRDAVSVEKQGKPVVAAVCEEFATHGRNTAKMLGHADLKMLVLPYPLEPKTEAEWRQVAADFYPQFLSLIGARK
jgi:hypothetical protein